MLLLHIAQGLVGISETCILGYNVNKGQEIYLRLRTDDGKGQWIAQGTTTIAQGG